jgi:DNA-binding transcriptional ArsR family regulator
MSRGVDHGRCQVAATPAQQEVDRWGRAVDRCRRHQGETVRLGPPAQPQILTGKSALAYCRCVAEELFKALADPTRRVILDELTERSGQMLFEICGRLSMKHQLTISRQAVSQHLAVLEAAGLVTSRREGRYKFHDLDTAPLRHIIARWPLPDAPESIP